MTNDISVHSETYGNFIILDAPSVLHLTTRACNVCTCRPHAVSCSPNAIHHGTPATNLLTAPQVGKPHPSVTCPCSGGRNLAPLRSNSLGEKVGKNPRLFTVQAIIGTKGWSIVNNGVFFLTATDSVFSTCYIYSTPPAWDVNASPRMI